MATQVEALLPGNPLAKPEEHGKVIRGGLEEEEGGRGEGAKRQAAVAEQGSSSTGQGGTPGTEQQQTSKASKVGSDNDDKQNEEAVKSGRKEFTEAPPPKVNPWTKKMNAVTVVSVNGQAHHGQYCPYVLVCVVSLLCRCVFVQMWS